MFTGSGGKGNRLATKFDFKLIARLEAHLLNVTFTDGQFAVELHLGFVGQAATTLSGGLEFKTFGFEKCFVELGEAKLVAFDVATLADEIRLVHIAAFFDFGEQFGAGEH